MDNSDTPTEELRQHTYQVIYEDVPMDMVKIPLDELEALLDRVRVEARIDELKQLAATDCFNAPYIFQGDQRPRKFINARIDTLTGEEPPHD